MPMYARLCFLTSCFRVESCGESEYQKTKTNGLLSQSEAQVFPQVPPTTGGYDGCDQVFTYFMVSLQDWDLGTF